MKRLYLAGPIFNVADPRSWRRDVANALPPGWTAVDPLDLEDLSAGSSAHEIVHADLAAIETCDVVLAKAVEPSWGTAMEIRFAFDHEISVICWRPGRDSLETVSPWLQYHCRLITSCFKEVLGFLNAQG